MADHSHTALIIIDSQQGAIEGTFWGPSRSNPSYEHNITTLLHAFRSLRGALGPHIIHVYHSSINPLSPLHPTSPGMAFHSSSLPEPNEPVFPKKTNSALQSSDLGDFLKAKGIWKVFFAGVAVDYCLGSTVRHASDLDVGNHRGEGGEVVKGGIVLVNDATLAWEKRGGSFDAETVHRVHVESLEGEFARVVTTEEVLRELGL
jgi:nicotinamidase-related amidase